MFLSIELDVNLDLNLEFLWTLVFFSNVVIAVYLLKMRSDYIFSNPDYIEPNAQNWKTSAYGAHY